MKIRSGPQFFRAQRAAFPRLFPRYSGFDRIDEGARVFPIWKKTVRGSGSQVPGSSRAMQPKGHSPRVRSSIIVRYGPPTVPGRPVKALEGTRRISGQSTPSEVFQNSARRDVPSPEEPSPGLPDSGRPDRFWFGRSEPGLPRKFRNDFSGKRVPDPADSEPSPDTRPNSTSGSRACPKYGVMRGDMQIREEERKSKYRVREIKGQEDDANIDMRHIFF